VKFKTLRIVNDSFVAGFLTVFFLAFLKRLHTGILAN